MYLYTQCRENFICSSKWKSLRSPDLEIVLFTRHRVYTSSIVRLQSVKPLGQRFLFYAGKCIADRQECEAIPRKCRRLDLDPRGGQRHEIAGSSSDVISAMIFSFSNATRRHHVAPRHVAPRLRNTRPSFAFVGQACAP